MAKRTRDGRVVEFFAIDAGGTMTDAVLIDKDGDFQVGKALSEPGYEAEAVMNAFQDALGYWGLDTIKGARGLSAVIYSGTQMINKVLTRQGEQPLGLIVTAGFEDMMRMERAVQVWLGLSYADRLHSVSHHHHEPLIPKRYIRGVRGRINVFFAEMIPLYEDEVYKAVDELLDEGIKALCVCLLFSFKNPAHEQRVREIALEIMKKRGVDIPVYLSCEICPVRGEFPRAQTTVLEAYAASPSRPHFQKIKERLSAVGSKAPLRLMTCYGGSIAPEHRMLASTMSGGPVGGVIGGKYLGEALGVENIVCSDVGGTSFDTGLVTEGRFTLDVEPSIAWMKTAIPAIVTESIGAGTGMYVRLDPVIKKIELGPESAGYKIGMCVKEKVPTINDCNLVLGYLNPDYFLGGKVKLSVEKAYNGIKKQLADPLGIDVYDAAEGIKNLVDITMRDSLSATVMGRGFSPEVYSLLCYGGAGPLHAAAYSAGLNFKNIFVPTWAAAFSAFGWGTSQPPTESMVAALKDTPYDTGLDLEKLNDIGERFVEISQKYRLLFTAEVTRPSVAVLLHQIPGGMISNLVSQLRDQKALDRLPEVLAEVPRVRAELGYPPLVTPTSQVVGTQAVLNVLTGQRYKQVTKETKNYLMGYYGAVTGEINPEISQAIIGDEKPITGRPADLLPPELPKAQSEAHKLGIVHKEEDIVTYALYPEVAVKFLRGELKEEKLAPAVPPAQAAAPVTMLPTEFSVDVDGEVFSVKVSPVSGKVVEAASAKSAKPKQDQKGAVLSPMNGMILAIKAKVGDKVNAGDIVATIEAMKMASEVCAPQSGTVTGVFAYEGELVNAKDVIMVIGD